MPPLHPYWRPYSALESLSFPQLVAIHETQAGAQSRYATYPHSNPEAASRVRKRQPSYTMLGTTKSNTRNGRELRRDR